MQTKDILSRIDHTLLKPDATWDSIKQLCDEAVEFKTASVCVPPSFVSKIREKYPDIVICVVIGFPLGYCLTQSKVKEAELAVEDGADEIDMVINIGNAKDGKFDEITDEISLVKSACGDKVLKVIIETCYLSDEEKIALCDCVTKGGADYIKTSTGFGSAGAQIEDIKLFRKHIGSNVKIKAAGGIRTREDMEKFILAGADRIGSSSKVLMTKTSQTG